MVEIVNQIHQNEPFKISLLKDEESEREVKPTHVLIFDSCPLSMMTSLNFLLKKISMDFLKKAKVIIIAEEEFKKIISCSLPKQLKHFYHIQNHPTLLENISILSCIIRYDFYPKYLCKNAIDLLSQNEHQVAHGFFEGETVRNLAKTLRISERTVYSHKRNAFRKLGFRVHNIIHHKIMLSLFKIKH